MFWTPDSWRIGFQIHLATVSDVHCPPAPSSISFIVSAAFLPADSAAARIPLGWPDTDDDRGIGFGVLDLYIFYDHTLDTGDEFR